MYGHDPHSLPGQTVPVPAAVPRPRFPAQAAQESGLIPVPCLLSCPPALGCRALPPEQPCCPHGGCRAEGSGWQADHGRAGRLWHGMVAVAQRGGHAVPGQGGRGAMGWPQCGGSWSRGGAQARQHQGGSRARALVRACGGQRWQVAGRGQGRRMPGRMPGERGAGSRQPSPRRSWPRSSTQGSLLGIKPPSAGAVPSRSRLLGPRIHALPWAGSPQPPGRCTLAPAARALRPGTARCSGRR